jgi:hypothetical protein
MPNRCRTYRLPCGWPKRQPKRLAPYRWRRSVSRARLQSEAKLQDARAQVAARGADADRLQARTETCVALVRVAGAGAGSDAAAGADCSGTSTSWRAATRCGWTR